MANSKLIAIVTCGFCFFIGVLVGNATKTNLFSSADVAAAVLSSPQSPTVSSGQCPPCPQCVCSENAAACPPCVQTPCPQSTGGTSEESGSGSDDAEFNQAPTSEERSEYDGAATTSVSGICTDMKPAPAPAPKGTYDFKHYYPLRKAYNRFEAWYDKHKTGKGVWKWTQYFPAWERHLAKFVAKSWAGEEVHMAELGIFSGGSLEMWQNVFGPGLRLWGVDIATVTKQYEYDDKSGRTKIFNMDQTNQDSWNEFKKACPKLDILIDDGLHLFKGQKATFDAILDHIAPGGVFMTEDISDGTRPGARARYNDGPDHKEKYFDYSFAKTRDIHVERTKIQSTIDSVHYYPYLFVVEKREIPLKPFGSGQPLAAIKHGKIWKPISHGVLKGEHAR